LIEISFVQLEGFVPLIRRTGTGGAADDVLTVEKPVTAPPPQIELMRFPSNQATKKAAPSRVPRSLFDSI